MKKFFFKIKGRKYDVEVKQFEEGIAKVDVNGTEYDVEVETPEKPVSKTPRLVRRELDEDKPKKAPVATGAVIKAPLPGNIFKVLVNVGDEVKEGQTVMVMEAMKMENNIQTESAGTIKSIKVNVGDAVMQDDVLIELG
ncbi:biotin-dependent enzyme [Balneicella halophila]|uniref:Biotin-dependent enzyme n=1 Tax=Balneicella halophila TaxID=1537566 RepID=A0A7L4UNZ7_BALHA|nr:biotin/lipoyl-containing protein [Balneicella halophila]PVX50831.1 biotin-dependent enzyme [Balneicella halophila]